MERIERGRTNRTLNCVSDVLSVRSVPLNSGGGGGGGFAGKRKTHDRSTLVEN